MTRSPQPNTDGIKKLNPSRFKDLQASIGASTDEGEVERVCIGSHELLRELAKQIDRGKFRF
jgi:hypothetical protein